MQMLHPPKKNVFNNNKKLERQFIFRSAGKFYRLQGTVISIH